MTPNIVIQKEKDNCIARYETITGDSGYKLHLAYDDTTYTRYFPDAIFGGRAAAFDKAKHVRDELFRQMLHKPLKEVLSIYNKV